MGQIRFTLRNAMLAITVFASCFALMGVAVGGMVGTVALIVALRPFPSQWQSCELAVIVAWFLGLTLEFSDLFAGLGLQFCVTSFGFASSVSWLLRLLNKCFAPHSETGWLSLFIVPTVFLLASVLAVLVLALHMKVTFSESTQRADPNRILIGHREPLAIQERWVGSFWVETSMRFGTSVSLSEGSSSTSERCLRMGKPVRLPTASDINVHDSLDEQYAAKHFSGKDLQQAQLLFQENFLSYQEDLLWMGPKAFCFYVQAAIDYLLSPESKCGRVDLFIFCSIVESRLDEEIGVAKPIIRQGIVKILDHYDRYDCEQSALGDVFSRLEALLTKL